MSKYLLSSMLGTILFILIACGGGATATPEAVQAPAATQVPAAAAQPAATTAPSAPAATTASAAPAPLTLAKYADDHAGGPGAIYLGDFNQLVGPAPAARLGDADGNVPLGSIQRHSYIYESDYYKSLLEKAKLENPTPLVTQGQKITLQHSCVSRPQPPCQLIENYLVPNVLARTGGQVEIQVTSYAELGISGLDTVRLVGDGTLGMSEIFQGFVAGEVPLSEAFSFWGLYPDNETEFIVQQAILPDMDKVFGEATNGGKVLFHNWYAGNDIYVFSKKPLRTLEDFKGLKIRSIGSTMEDAFKGLGAEPQFITPADVYTALDRGVVDGAASGSTFAFSLKWFEVADYIVGPYRSFPVDFVLINKDVWEDLPEDIQQILIEEGAKNELEAARLSSIQNELGVPRMEEKGMELIPFSPELQEYAFENAIIKRMIPNWVKRVGGPDSPEARLFNEKIAPIAGVQINPDGTASRFGEAPAAVRLAQYAADHAGGPGAIYVGDLNQLVGSVSAPGLGDADKQIPLDLLERNEWIYNSDRYKYLLESAKLNNPTPLVSSGQSFDIQYACINAVQPPCQLMSSYFIANVLERTNGQVDIQAVSYPELGISGTDVVALVGDGTLSMTEAAPPLVGGNVPALDIFSFYGLFSDHETEFRAQHAILPEVDNLVSEASDGGVVVTHNWYSGNDIFVLSKDPLRTPEDFEGRKIRTFGTTLTDSVNGLGADPQFITPADVYTALDRGVVEGATSGASFGLAMKWYETTDYIVGPWVSFPATFVIINEDVWDDFPQDIQQILLEEGAKLELESLRVAAVQIELGLPRMIEKGMEHIPFTPEVAEFTFQRSILDRMLPGWANRVGGVDTPIVKLFNDKFGPIAGVKINPDGTASRIE